MNELTRLLKENFDYSMTNIHTAFPGVVVKYDKDTRRADIQPSIKRKLPSGEFVDFPVIPDAPVLFPGTKQYTVCYPLEKDDEVLCICMERGTDTWRDNGGSGIEETDPRRFSLMDCIVIPGLQPLEFIGAEGDGFCVVHKAKPDGDLISSVVMDDDKIQVTQQKAVLTVKGNKLSFKNDSKDFFTVMSKILDDMKTAAQNSKTFAGNAKGHKTVGSPANHNVSPDDQAKFAIDEQNFNTDAQNFGTDKTDLGKVMEAGE
jgi:hypothetical protein